MFGVKSLFLEISWKFYFLIFFKSENLLWFHGNSRIRFIPKGLTGGVKEISRFKSPIYSMFL